MASLRVVSRRWIGLAFVGVAAALAAPSTALSQGVGEIRVKAYAQHVGRHVRYHYEVVNGSGQRIAAVWIGSDYTTEKYGTFELKELPVGWAFNAGIPSTSVTVPKGWEARLITPEGEPSHAIEWDTTDREFDLLPGQTLSGLSVLVERRDDRHLRGQARILFSDGYPKNRSVPLELVDVTPPSISVSVDPGTLWPPNGKPTTVRARLVVRDDFDPSPEVRLEAITANEPLGASDVVAEIGTDDRELALRATRSGQSRDGRVYTVTYSARDASGNVSVASAAVNVPHDQR